LYHWTFISGLCDFTDYFYESKYYIGLQEVIKLYETISGINDILEKANEFKRANPGYSINNFKK